MTLRRSAECHYCITERFGKVQGLHPGPRPPKKCDYAQGGTAQAQGGMAEAEAGAGESEIGEGKDDDPKPI